MVFGLIGSAGAIYWLYGAAKRVTDILYYSIPILLLDLIILDCIDILYKDYPWWIVLLTSMILLICLIGTVWLASKVV
jgi:hypothetical protein